MALISVEVREPSLIRIDGAEAANRRSGDDAEESESHDETTVDVGGPVGAIVSAATTLASLYGVLRSLRSEDEDFETETGVESSEAGGDEGNVVERADEGYEIAVEEEPADAGRSLGKVAVGLALVAALALGAYFLRGSDEESDLDPQF